jgi:hypothetical protein
MKIPPGRFSLLVVSAIFLCFCLQSIVSPTVQAHPGNTSSDGGHYCWSNCDYWGYEYGTRHYHDGGSGKSYAQEYTQAVANAREFANQTNRAYIDYQANQDGSTVGSEDGNANKAKETGFYGIDADICDNDVKFENEVSDYYERTFDNYYKEACEDVYEIKYKTAYAAAYDEGLAKYNEEQEILRKEQNDKNTNNMIGGGMLASAALLVFGVRQLFRS